MAPTACLLGRAQIVLVRFEGLEQAADRPVDVVQRVGLDALEHTRLDPLVDLGAAQGPGRAVFSPARR